MEELVRSEILSPVCSGTGEVKVIRESEWEVIRAMADAGQSGRAIARELGLDVKTVRKWLKKEFRRQERRSPAKAIDGFVERIARRGPEVGFNGKVILRELKAEGYEGSYAALARHLQPLRAAWRAAIAPSVRYETGPGQQAQVDWGSMEVWLGAEAKRCHFFVMILGYSRRVFAIAYLNEKLDSLLDAHAKAFAHFGGRTREILYDNPRTIVLRKDEASGVVEWNRSFKDRMDYYGVKVRLCRYYRAQTKGKVESGIKYVKRNALAGRRFRDLEELNEWLLEWCMTIADQRVHGTTHELPAARFDRDEAAVLIAVDGRVPVLERVVTRIVPKDAYVAVEANRYPVPLEWVGQTVTVRIEPSEILIHFKAEASVCYMRLKGEHQVASWQGPPRIWERKQTLSRGGAPQFDPAYYVPLGEVESRSLEAYAMLAEEGGR